MLVERGMVMLERFVMAQITGASPVEDGSDQAGMMTTDTTRGLNILRGCLGLTVAYHQTQPGYIDAHRDHVRGQKHIQWARFEILWTLALLASFFP